VVAAAAALSLAQEIPQDIPRIGLIEFFGLNKVKEPALRTALQVREGDALPPSKGDAEERLDKIPGVVESHLEAVCCPEGKVILYVGIEEVGAPHFDLREPPEGDVSLPAEVTSLYRDFLEAVQVASRRGSTAEDLTNGHSLMADPLAREIQLKFPEIAKERIDQLRRVLRNAADEEQRATAAYILGYALRKQDVVNDLQSGLRDPAQSVRSNAVGALLAIAIYARRNPDLAIKVQPVWFVEMVNSLSWSDRDRALKALQVLTDTRDAVTLEMLRDRALNSLVEMSRWKTLSHALPAFVLLGRVAGLSEEQIQDAWTRGDRESVISAAMRKKMNR
jgi:hypothetical protein